MDYEQQKAQRLCALITEGTAPDETIRETIVDFAYVANGKPFEALRDLPESDFFMQSLAFHNRPKAFRELVVLGFHPNLPNRKNVRPLHVAYESGRFCMAHMIVCELVGFYQGKNRDPSHLFHHLEEATQDFKPVAEAKERHFRSYINDWQLALFDPSSDGMRYRYPRDPLMVLHNEGWDRRPLRSDFTRPWSPPAPGF